jgi:hypothetical protein
MKKQKLSFFEIIASLARSAPIHAPESEPDDKRVTQSVRLPQDVRAWTNIQAEHLGISIQDFIALTMKGVMVATNSPNTHEYDTVLTRFFSLFQEHDISTIDIPRFLPPNTIKASSLRDTDQVIDMLQDDEVIKHLCNLFDVRKSWLKGEDNVIYENHRFYKSLPSILAEITRYKIKTGTRVEVFFVTKKDVSLERLAEFSKEDKHYDDTSVHIVLKFDRVINNQTISTYQIWDSLSWDYSPTRMHAKALLLFCDKTQNYPTALALNDQDYNDFVTNRQLLPTLLKRGRNWMIEELVWENDERNTEQKELPDIKEFFKKEGGDPYLRAIRHSLEIINHEEFISGKQPPKFKKE